jgi:hypothetical protein
MMEPDCAGACAASLETLPAGRFLTRKRNLKKKKEKKFKERKIERCLFKDNHAIGRSKRMLATNLAAMALSRDDEVS